MLTRLRLTIAVLAVLAILSSALPLAAQGQTKVRIVDPSRLLLYLPLYMAKELGYFADEGLDVDVFSAGNTAIAATAVLSDNAEFIVTGPTRIAVAMQKGQDLRLLAQMVTGVPYSVVARPGVQVSPTAVSLQGKTAITWPSPWYAFFLFNQWVDRVGLKAGSTIRIIELRPEAVAQSLLAGQGDIAIVQDPALRQVLAAGGTEIYKFGSDYRDWTWTGIGARKKYIDANPDVTQRVVKAIAKASRTIYAEPEQAYKVAARWFPTLEAAAAREMLDRAISRSFFAKTPVVSRPGLAQDLNFNADNGVLTRPVPSYEEVTVNQFAERSARP